MTDLTNPDVQELLTGPNFAVISTHNPDDTIHSAVVWIEGGQDTVSVNSAVGRKWPTNLERNANTTVVVIAADNPYFFVEIRGTATGATDDADDQIDRLAKKYLGKDEYPFRRADEQRIKFVITPRRVTLVKQ
jgi:PPOX class probable F420-dependent enzyme